jgi:HEAT repeat protein
MADITNRRASIVLVSCFLICLFIPAIAAGQTLDDWSARSEALSQNIEHGNTEQKRDSLFEIRNLRTAEASRLALPALKDGSEMVRATAAASVIFLPENEAVQALVPLLGDKAEFVRREAAYALGLVGSGLATPALLKLIQNEKVMEVRTATSVALGGTGDPAAVPQLVSTFKDRPTEENEFLRRSAARSIGQIAQIIKTGKRRVVTPQNFMPEKYKDFPAGIPVELTVGLPQFKQAVETLASVLKNKNEADDTRREAAFALGAVGDAAATATLDAAIGSTDPYLAEIAKEAKVKIESQKANVSQ